MVYRRFFCGLIASLALAGCAGGNGTGSVLAGTCTQPTDMIQKRAPDNMVLLKDGRVMVIGSVTAQTSAELYDPNTGIWTNTQNMNTARASPTAVLLSDGRVLVSGGDDSTGSVHLNSAEVYDPTANTWTPTLNTMSDARRNHAATLLDDGQVLVTGGAPEEVGLSVDPFRSADTYDPATNRWTSVLSKLTEGRGYHQAVVLKTGAHAGNVLIAGGRGSGNNATASVELYDPVKRTFSTTAQSMSNKRFNYRMTLLSDGRVLAIGGSQDGLVTISAVERYDPASDQWQSVASMNQSRTEHTATLLKNGNIIVAGGSDGNNSLKSIEVYDSTADTWQASSDMKQARDSHAAILLDCGNILVAGGQENFVELASVELL